MELELGLKITRTREDVSSSVDFRFSKDPFGPLVLSQETDSRFIIIIHLKGFKKEGIEIEINKEGNRITIRGRKPVEEIVLIRWMAWMKEVELRTFKKVFLIPDIVDLDKIKARFDDDDATLTITMPKNVKGISGFKLEEEDEEEESVDFEDVSETQNREEEFGEMMEDKERESRVFEGEEKGFSGGLDGEETQIEDDDLEKIQQIDEQDKILGLAEEETVSQEELADLNTETEDSSLRKLLDIIEQEDQEVMEKQVETKSEGTESRAVEEIEEPDELNRTSKSKAVEKKTSDGDDDDGLRKAQLIEEPERQNEESKVQEMVEEETGGQEEVAETETKAEEFESEREIVGQQEFAGSNTEIEDSILRKLPDILEQENNQEVMEQKVSQVETKSDDNNEQEPDERLDRTSDGGAKEKKTTDDDGDGLRKVQGIEEPEGHNEGSKIQNIIEVKGGEEKLKRDIKNGDPKEDLDEKMGEGFTPSIERTGVVGEDDIVETETKAEEFESGKPEADEVDKIHELVEKKEEEEEKNANIGTQSEDISLIKPHDTEEQQSQGNKPHEKREKIKELVEEKAPEAETNIGNDTPKQKDMVEEKTPEAETNTENDVRKPVQEIEVPEVVGQMGVPNIAETETKPTEFESEKQVADEVDKIHELVEKKKEEEEEKNAKVGTQSEDISSRKPQEIQEKQSQGQKRHDKHEKIKELVEEQTPEAETNVGNENPKPVQERSEGKPAEFESDKLEADEVDKIHELVEKKKEEDEEEEKNAKVGTQIEDISLRKPQEIQEQQSQGHKRHDKHEKIKELVEEEQTPEAEKNMGNETPKPVQEICEGKQKIKENFQEETKKQPEEHKGSRKSQEIIRQQGLDEPERCEKESKPLEINDEEKEEKEIADMETKEQESYRPKILEEEEKVQELAEEKKLFSKNRKLKEEEKIPENKTEFGDDDVSRKVGDNQQRDSDAKEEVGTETETKAEKFEPHKLEPDEVDEIHGLVEKKEVEEENAKVRRQSEDISFIKLQENENQHSKGQEKTAEPETNIPKPVQETETEVPEVDTLGKTDNEGKEGNEKKKSVMMEIKNVYPKEKADAKNGKGFTANIAETETNPEEFESDKVDEVHELVEKKEEEEDKLEDSSLVKKLQETEEQQFQGQKRHNKQEKVKEILEEKTPAAETNIADEIPEPVQVIDEPEVDTLQTCREKEIAETEAKEQDSCRPKTLVELEKIQELAEEEVAEKKTELGDDDHNISRKVGDIDQRDSYAKEVDAEMGKVFTPNISETEKKAGEVGKIHELVDKKKEEEEENDKVSKKSEYTSLRRLQEQRFQGPSQHNKQENIKDLVEEKPEAENPKPVQETERPEVETLETCEDKESAETKTKEKESYRPGEDKIQELGEEEMNFSRNVDEEEEIAEKKTESGDDDMSRKVRDIEQRGSDTMKGEEEKDKIQELVLEDKSSDGGEIIIAEATAENDKSRKVQETDEQQPHEEDKRGNQFQKVIGREISGHGVDEDVENEKQTTEAYKRLTDSAREAQPIERTDSDVSGKYGKGDMIQELQENRTPYQNEQEEENENEADGPEKLIGAIEQELVNLKSLVEQDNVEDGEETPKLVEDKTKEEESDTKTDDVVRKIQGIKEHELFEPKRDHVSKIKEVVEEKVAELEIEAESGGLSKAHGSEEQKLHKPDIHKESGNTKTNGTEEPSGQEKEEEKKEKTFSLMFTNVQEIKEERPDKPETHEKQYKIQELVEAEHNDHKEEQEDEKLILKAKRETEEARSENVQEIEKQESDGLKRPTVQDKKQETKEKEITRAMKEKQKTKTEDGSLRKVQDEANLELSRPYKRQEEDKLEELVETGTSDYREKVKKQDVNDILRSQEPGCKPNLDEFERHREQRNVPKLVDEEKMENIAKQGVRLGDDDSAKFHEFEERKSYEDWTHDEREKIKDLVKEEATDPKDKHTGEAGHNDHREEQQEERVIAEAGQKAEEDSSEKVQEFDEEDKTRAMEENEIVERRTKTKDGSLRKVLEGEEDPELRRHKTEEEDMIPDLVEADISGHREKVKKKDGDDMLRSQETGKLDLGELERHGKQRKIHQPVKDEKGKGTMENISEPGGTKEGDSSGKFHEFQKQKSYEDWRKEESEQIEEATDPKDKHLGGKGEHEQEIYEKGPQAKTKGEDEVNKKVGGNRKEEENLVDDSTTKIQETEKEKSHKSKINEKLDIVQDFVEDETGDQEDERAGEAVVANNEKDSSRKLHSTEGEELKEPEEHKEQDEISKTSDSEVKEEEQGERFAEKEKHVQELEGKTENLKHDDGEGRRREIDKQGKTVETQSEDGIVRKIDEIERRETSNHVVELVTEDDNLRKGQEFLENESSNVSERRPVDQEEIQQLKEVEKQEDEEKSVAEIKGNAGKSRKFEMQELDEPEENEELKKIRKPMEEKTSAPIKEKRNEKIADVKMQDKIDTRMKDQDTKRPEPYELLENEEHDKIPEAIVQGTKYQREEEKRVADSETEEMKRIAEDVSSRKAQKTKEQESDGLEKHRKLSDIQENQSVEEKIHEHGGEEQEEVNEGGGYKTVLKTKSTEDSSTSQDVVGKRSDQTEKYTEQETIQGLMVDEEGKEEYHIREGEQNKKAKRIPQVELKANGDNSKKNVTERLSGQKQNEDHQELVEMEKTDQRKEVSEDKIVEKGEVIDHEYKIQEHEEGNSDKHERYGEEEWRGTLAEEETSNDKEENRGNRAGAERKIRDDGFEEEEELAQETLKKSFVEGKARENKNHEAKSRDDNSRKTQENEKQESREQQRNYEEQNKKILGPNYSRNEEDGKEDKEIAEAEGPRELKGIENQDNINELVEEKINNQEGEDKKSMSMEVLAKSEDHESEEPERLRKQDKTGEVLQQRLRDNLEAEETAKTETKSNDNESRKIHQINDKETGEEDRCQGQGRTKELVEDRTPEIDKEGLTEPGRDEKHDEIEERVDRETSEDDEEELEVEVEDSEEDWEAEVVQEMDSDKENDNIRHIRRIKLGFRLVGGSTLFMSLIVIVISIIRSKRKIRCYKF